MRGAAPAGSVLPVGRAGPLVVRRGRDGRANAHLAVPRVDGGLLRDRVLAPHDFDDRAVLAGGSLSLNGAISGLTTTVGSAARHSTYAAEAQGVLHGQAQARRDSVSGVNLDEEAANMLQLQQAYQAAAQIIATADTLFQSLLGAVRR